nr:MAG TPA: hypothetical protein [Caudoviricetes sp.]
MHSLMATLSIIAASFNYRSMSAPVDHLREHTM